MVIVGLTGGIGSGKSTVAMMFKDEGAHVIDFDYLARRVVEPDKPAWRDIVDYFGPEILSSDGTVNRSALAKIVFSDDKRRKVLEGFIHPRIFEEKDVLIKAIKRKDPCSVVIVDIPLLFELDLRDMFDKVMLAYVPRAIQIRRVLKKGALRREEVEKRLNAQIPIEEKRSLSDYVIHNEGSIKDTRAQVREIIRELKESATRKGGESNCC
jgi:dephospho-CoA kinase